WSGDATGTNPSILITMNSPKNIVANFDAYHRVVLKTMPEGLPLPSINPPSSDGFYKEGTIVTLIAANITGYRFVKWYVNNVEKGIGQTSITLTIDKPLTIAAVYKKLLPDIIVKCTPNDVKVNESENISIQVEVSNIGEVSTGPFNVIGNIKRDNIIILPQQDISINPWPISFIIPNLNPGETIKLQLTVSRLPSGEYTLEIIADPENKLPEKREDNNICTCNITVFYIARFESHCLIENKYVTTTIIVNGKTYTTPIELKLIGENKVVATEKDSLGHPFLIWLKDNMDYSSNREITISKAGKYTIIYGEKNKPNIKVNISWTPIEPIAGETIQFNLKIINEGSIQASIFNFTYGVNNIKLGELKINGLMANETFTWSFNYTANTNFTIWAYADPYNSIEEISKIDNKIEKRVDIWVPYTPKPEEIQLTIDLKDKRTCINITMALTNYTYRIVKWGEISKVNNTFTCNMIIERYTLPTYKITKLEHTYELDIPIDGQYIFNLNVKDTLIKSKTFIIDRTPPLISVFYPSNNSHIKISRTVNIWINGTIIELNKGSSKPLINDTRFTLTTWVPSSGSFAFKNNTSIPSGPITINISFTDEHGNTASTTIQFTITQNTPPKPIITYTPSAPLVNQTIVFNASSSIDPDGKITSFEWRFDDNTTASGAITNHSYTKPGTYKVSLKIVDDDYATSETSIEITIYNAIVYLPKISAYPKSNIIIPITIYARNLGAYDLNITFNPSTISVTNVIGGEKPFDTPIWKIDPKGYVKINQFIPTTQGPTGNITVAYLNITVTDEPNKHSELYTQITSLINAATGSEITPRTALNGSINTLEYISLKVAVKFNIDIIDEHVVLNAYLNSTETLEGGLGAYMIKIRVNPKTILINTREGITPFSIPPIANKVNDTIIITSFISEKKGPQMENFKLFGVIIRFNSSVNEKVIFNIENLTLVSAYTGKEYRSKIVFTPLTFIRGDANNDGKVNIADAMFIAQYLAGNRPASDLNLLNAASVKHDDENGDKVSIADAMFIAQYLAGLRDEYMNLKGGG
ncbi:MAG: CARDB domain-containing protein, partial [Ignisphaera sp.]